VLAAVKCVPLGQTDGQRLLLALGDRIAPIVAARDRMDDDDLANFAPGLAILSARHETQYSRIFRSMRALPLRVGIGGPVGSGKTALTLALCKALRDKYDIAAGHQRHLHRGGRALPRDERRRSRPDRILGVRPAAARTPRSARTPPSTSRRSSGLHSASRSRSVLHRVGRRQPRRRPSAPSSPTSRST
jgi:hypothetical protein